MKLRSVVVGLGRIGSRFDEEPGRTAVWSHVGAYLACPTLFQLVGAVETDAENAAAFAKRCPHVPIYKSIEELSRSENVDVVSVCTPTKNHSRDIAAVIKSLNAQLIWCEKPLAMSSSDALDVRDAAGQANMTLVVSYVRRWLPLWRRVREISESGLLGEIVSVRVFMPNRLFSIQSHAIDLALFLGGAVRAFRAKSIESLQEDDEPAALIDIDFASGAYGLIHPSGMKSALVVEAEIMGSAGRLRASEADGLINLEKFEKSLSYEGYRELVRSKSEVVPGLKNYSPFVAIAEEIASAWSHRNTERLDNGESSCQVQKIIDSLEIPLANSTVIA